MHFIFVVFVALSVASQSIAAIIIVPRDQNDYYTPYEPNNGPMRGPNSLETHKYGHYSEPDYSHYRDHYDSYNDLYDLYQPDNGPMRGPNSLDAYKYHLYGK